MDFNDYINHNNMRCFHWEHPIESVYLEFCYRRAAAILELGEFEAFRRWILSDPDCFKVPAEPETAHLVARRFFKALRAEKRQ